ncbi:hypothetical protein [Nocardioides litoris]|uniref:hypothetical protein n=1 Tax=Nocardioides litoris TaxID=1926648 RepID=UPI001120380A|nr:hypothetical protein [Nocardioides litoris]
MSWLGLLLVGVALADVGFSLTRASGWSALRRARTAEAGAAVAVLLLGVLAGLDEPRHLLGLVVIGLGVVAWGESVTYGFGARRYAVPLGVLGLLVVAGLVASGPAPAAHGLLEKWLEATDLAPLDGLDPDRALLVTGVLLVQLSTGNVLVRLVLGVTGTTNPLRDTVAASPAPSLKGGRILGPLERVFIVVLWLAGEATAASIVVAAKALLRFPELQAARADGSRPGLHEVTEYFLVGSFVSWTVSLGSLALLGA